MTPPTEDPYAVSICRGPASLRDAMASLERSGIGIVIFLDGEGRLCGTLTDGDIRRALLGGHSLEDPAREHMQAGFAAVAPDDDRAAVLDLMRARGVGQVPILDREGRYCGLHLLREIVGAKRRSNWAVVMAGGEGRRLRPITETVAKPMLRVAGRPILERIVLQLVGYGIARIFLAVNYLAHTVMNYFGDGRRFGCTIEYLQELEPLGTAGALGLLPELPADSLLLMNGDLVTQANLGAMLDFHQDGRQAATVGLHRYLHTVPYGCVEMDGSRVRRIEEKPTLSRLTNSGIYVLTPEVVSMVEPNLACSATELLERCIGSDQLVCGYEISDDWIDVGRLEQLELAVRGN